MISPTMIPAQAAIFGMFISHSFFYSSVMLRVRDGKLISASQGSEQMRYEYAPVLPGTAEADIALPEVG